MSDYTIHYAGVDCDKRLQCATLEEAKDYADKHLSLNASAMRIYRNSLACSRIWYSYGDADIRKCKDPIEIYPLGFYGDWSKRPNG